MKLLALMLLAALPAYGADDFRMFWWQESLDEKTGEKLSACYLAPEAVKAVYEAFAKGDETKAKDLADKLPPDARSYILAVKGEAKTYPKEKIVLAEGTICGDVFKLDSGNVEVDRKASTVRVALKIIRDGKLVDFPGNGVYDLKQATKK